MLPRTLPTATLLFTSTLNQTSSGHLALPRPLLPDDLPPTLPSFLICGETPVLATLQTGAVSSINSSHRYRTDLGMPVSGPFSLSFHPYQLFPAIRASLPSVHPFLSILRVHRHYGHLYRGSQTLYII
ncbi:hypothetical protein EDD85DRAFT_799643 [Armillaria nabsnona]|nr:hypothetical protein EDD85DRAFT_799643 [Armillaria nabsnona]